MYGCGGLVRDTTSAAVTDIPHRCIATQRIASEWRKQALAACDIDVKSYWVCRQDAGLAVIFKCRTENDAMNACVARHAGDVAAWERFRAERISEAVPALLEKRAALLEARLAALREKPST